MYKSTEHEVQGTLTLKSINTHKTEYKSTQNRKYKSTQKWEYKVHRTGCTNYIEPGVKKKFVKTYQYGI